MMTLNYKFILFSIALLVTAVTVFLILLVYYYKVRTRYLNWKTKRLRVEVANLTAIKAWGMINELRGDASSGFEVTIACDNDDPPPGAAIECCGDWTNWETKRFEGADVLDALFHAVTIKRSYKP